MIFNARKRFRRTKTKHRIDSSIVVCSDDILLFDLIEQFILVCCCTVFVHTYKNGATTIMPLATKPQSETKKYVKNA